MSVEHKNLSKKSQKTTDNVTDEHFSQYSYLETNEKKDIFNSNTQREKPYQKKIENPYYQPLSHSV
jgi:hypothetical protein